MKYPLIVGTLAAVGAAASANESSDNVPVVTALALAPRHDCPSDCSPQLCVGEATMSGQVTQLTYVCPESKQKSTVYVTVTKTTTVTPTPEVSILPIPESTSGIVSIQPAPPGISKSETDAVEQSDEPTTTTLIATSTLFMTITLVRPTSIPEEPLTPPSFNPTSTLFATSVSHKTLDPMIPIPTGINSHITDLLPSGSPVTQWPSPNNSTRTSGYGTGTAISFGTGISIGTGVSRGTGVAISPTFHPTGSPFFGNSTASSAAGYRYPPNVVVRKDIPSESSYPGAVTVAMDKKGESGQIGACIFAVLLPLILALGM